MHTHSTQASPEATHAVAEQKSTVTSPKRTAQRFVDNRPKTAAQQTMQRVANNTPDAVNRTGLPASLKSGIEQLSGYSMNDVRVHYNSAKPAQMQAHAYAQGTDIHVATGQEKHLPHEAWHVVQQKQGRVQPTLQLKGGIPVNDHAGLEHEATVMGERAHALGQTSSQSGTAQRCAPCVSIPLAQRVVQRSTLLTYENEPVGKRGSTQIQGVTHHRSSVHDQAKGMALANGAWATKAPGSVANHSHSYANIVTNLINNDIDGQTLTAASANLLAHYAVLWGGAGGGGHANVLANLAGNVNNVENRHEIAHAFDYYIYKICDYPENIFYWPDRTGGNPDEPATDYSLVGAVGTTPVPGPWVFNGAAIAGDAGGPRVSPRTTERNRLNAGRGTLNGLGL